MQLAMAFVTEQEQSLQAVERGVIPIHGRRAAEPLLLQAGFAPELIR